MTKTYKVYTIHEIYEDDYNEGQGKMLHFFSEEDNVYATSPEEAIETRMNDLGYTFDMELADVDEQDPELVRYSVQLDTDGNEATEEQFELFKKGKLDLTVLNIEIRVWEVTPISFSK